MTGWILQQFIQLAAKEHFRFHVIYDRLSKNEEAYLQQEYCQDPSCLSFRQSEEEFLSNYTDYNLRCPRNPHWDEIGHRLFAYVLYRNLFEDASTPLNSFSSKFVIVLSHQIFNKKLL